MIWAIIEQILGIQRCLANKNRPWYTSNEPAPRSPKHTNNKHAVLTCLIYTLLCAIYLILSSWSLKSNKIFEFILYLQPTFFVTR